ncbi:MAG: hypothetical protein AB8C84_10700 [Oligoflexales bacterium]
MKRFIFLTLLFSQLAFGATLPKSAFFFDVYGEKIPVTELQDGDEIQVVGKDHKVQEAEIFNVSLNNKSVSFDVLDYDDENAVRTAPKKHKIKGLKKSASKTLKTFTGLAVLASIPAASALPVGLCSMGCVVICRTTCVAGPLVFPAMAPFCFAVETAGGCEAGCATAAFLLPC